jgi:hypothetical protein
MKLIPLKLKWYPVSQKPTEPGVYMIWSKRLGARIDSTHPSWWNHRNRKFPDRNGPKVTRWAYLWPQGHWRHADNG